MQRSLDRTYVKRVAFLALMGRVPLRKHACVLILSFHQLQHTRTRFCLAQMATGSNTDRSYVPVNRTKALREGSCASLKRWHLHEIANVCNARCINREFLPWLCIQAENKFGF